MKTESPAPGKDEKKSSALLFGYGGVRFMPAPVVTPTMTGIGLSGTF